MTIRGLGSKLLALGVSLALFCGAGEILLRVWFRFATSYDVEMTRYANELKVAAADPRIGHVHRPNRRLRLMDVTVETNSDGLRDREYPVARTGARRIVFLGDSLTFGWGVEKRETFEQRLEEALSAVHPTEVLNFGAGNYNTEQQVALFMEKGLKYRPDGVVVFYFINDAEPTPHRSSWAFLGRSRLVTLLWSRGKALASRSSAARSWRAYYAGLYREGQPGWEATKRAFLRLRDVCRERSIRLQVVFLPELHDPARYPFREEHRKVAEFLGRNGVESLDLAPSFASIAAPRRLWVAPDDAHPNAAAHALIAKHLIPYLSAGYHEI